MTKSRASIFDEPEEPKELDVSGFAPKSAVAEAAHFSSREPKPQKQTVPAKRAPRRHRTGRNVQLNLKASQETVDAFYAISDKNDWVLGETLEMAIQSLQRELQLKK